MISVGMILIVIASLSDNISNCKNKKYRHEIYQ